MNENKDDFESFKKLNKMLMFELQSAFLFLYSLCNGCPFYFCN